MSELANHVKRTMVIVFALTCWMIVPLILYFLYRLKEISHSMMVRKRYPQILTLQAIITILIFISTSPLECLAFAELNDYNLSIQLMITRINTIYYPLTSLAIMIVISWRFWLIYFDLKHASSQKNSEWKYHLDPDLVEHNFWLTHHQDYGCFVWTQKRVFYYYILNVVSLISAYQISIGTDYMILAHALSVFWHSIPINIILILFFKMPQYSDDFFIREELRTVAIAVFVSFVAALSVVISGFFVSFTVLLMAASVAALFCIFAISYVTFWYIPNKIRRKELDIMLKSLARCDEESVNSSESPQNAGNNHHKMHIDRIVNRLSQNVFGESKKAYKLHTILSNHKTFKLFMQHLAKEFSMECLLCFAEVMQYKFLLQQRADIIDSELITSKSHFTEQCPLSEVVPLSLINRTGFNQHLADYEPTDDVDVLLKEAKNVCLKLYYKYIEDGCSLEVNISYECRKRLEHLMCDETFWRESNIATNEMFCMFDEVATSMFGLMRGSFTRFKQKKVYKDATEILKASLSAIPKFTPQVNI